MLIVRVSRRAIELEILPVADPGHELDAQEIGQPKNGQVLALGIGVNGRGLDRRAVANQAIQDINGFPDATRNEMTELYRMIFRCQPFPKRSAVVHDGSIPCGGCFPVRSCFSGYANAHTVSEAREH